MSCPLSSAWIRVRPAQQALMKSWTSVWLTRWLWLLCCAVYLSFSLKYACPPLSTLPFSHHPTFSPSCLAFLLPRSHSPPVSLRLWLYRGWEAAGKGHWKHDCSRQHVGEDCSPAEHEKIFLWLASWLWRCMCVGVCVCVWPTSLNLAVHAYEG